MNSIRTAVKAVLVGALAMMAAPLAASGPIGDLEVRGTALIEAAGDGNTTRLRDTGYAWYSGDRLRTDDATGVLNLANGGSLGIDKQSDATIAFEAGTVTVDLIEGSLLYALDHATPMQVTVGDYQLVTTTGQARATQVSNDNLQVAGVIHRTGDGEVEVAVRGGELALNRGGQRYVVTSGERATLSGDAVEIISVQLDREIRSEEDEGLGAWIRENPGLFSLAVIGTAAAGYGIYEWQDDDDDDDPDPVSP